MTQRQWRWLLQLRRPKPVPKAAAGWSPAAKKCFRNFIYIPMIMIFCIFSYRKVSAAIRLVTALVKMESYFLKQIMLHWNMSQILGAQMKMGSRWYLRLSELSLSKVVTKALALAFSVQVPTPVSVMIWFAILPIIVLMAQTRDIQNFVDVSTTLVIFPIFLGYLLISYHFILQISMLLSSVKHRHKVWRNVTRHI